MSEPTPYPEVNAVIALLLREVRAILGDAFTGMYLFGSLSGGDFDPDSSDVDFLVVTEHPLPEPMLTELAAMHQRIAASGLKWATKLEGSYIPRAALRRYDPNNADFPTIGLDWEFGVGHHGSPWIIESNTVRERGVVVAGPPPKTLIDPVPPEMLRAAVLDTIRSFWANQLDGPEWLRTRNYQAFAILTMCRALYTVEFGTSVSKPVAAAWAKTVLPAPWPALIDRALERRRDETPDDMDDMLAFMRYTIERIG